MEHLAGDNQQRPFGVIWVRHSHNRAGVAIVSVDGLHDLDLLHEHLVIPWCQKNIGKHLKCRLDRRSGVMKVTGDFPVELLGALWKLSPTVTVVSRVDVSGRVVEVEKPTEHPDVCVRIVHSLLDSILSKVVKMVEDARLKEAKRRGRLRATQVGIEKSAERLAQLDLNTKIRAQREADRRERTQDADEVCECILRDLRTMDITGDDLSEIFNEHDSRSAIPHGVTQTELEERRATYAAQAHKNAAKAVSVASAVPVGEKSAIVFYKGSLHKKVWENAHQKISRRNTPTHTPSPFLKLTAANLRLLGGDSGRSASSPSQMTSSTVYGSVLCGSTIFDFGRASLHLKQRMFQRGISFEEMRTAAVQGEPILLKTRRDRRGRSGTRVYLFNDIVYIMDKAGKVGITAWRSEAYLKWVKHTKAIEAASVPPQGGPLGVDTDV